VIFTINLKDVRTAAGITQEQLAERVGVIRQTISNIECGLAKPSIDTAKAIGEVFGFDWVLFYEDR